MSDVLELVREWGDNSGRFRVTLVVVRSEDRRLLANVHIGPPHNPATTPSR
jgi:hypothetical protein